MHILYRLYQINNGETPITSGCMDGSKEPQKNGCLNSCRNIPKETLTHIKTISVVNLGLEI
jgi:hypothetical protein